MTTPLYPTFQKRISDSFDQLIKNQVTPWAFLNTGKPMRVKTHDNRPISYEGIGFEGSPEQVFWSSYVDPFMEEIGSYGLPWNEIVNGKLAFEDYD